AAPVPVADGGRPMTRRSAALFDGGKGLSFAVRTLLGVGLSVRDVRTRLVERAERAAASTLSTVLAAAVLAQRFVTRGWARP
ncbi:hypothetical protein, partial [Halorussus sp. GCM10023401]